MWVCVGFGCLEMVVYALGVVALIVAVDEILDEENVGVTTGA